MLAAGAALAAAAAAGAAPPCDLTKAPDDYCADFCSYKCGFYNASIGETGAPRNMTVYRITPANVTGPTDKNTADAPGDITFTIEQKNTTQICLHDPDQMGCNTDVERKDLYGAFQIEVDGQWGPYVMCNPADGWDTKAWICGMQCLEPTHAGCGKPSWGPARNGTNNGAPVCWCGRTGKAAGRQDAPQQSRSGFCYPGMVCPVVPDAWPAQCTGGTFGAPNASGSCYTGEVRRSVAGWSAAAAQAEACKQCGNDDACTGWRARGDGTTVDLFGGELTEEACDAEQDSSAKFHKTHGGGPGSKWFGVGNIGGTWYSHTTAGECAPGKPLGTDGCTWRLVKTIAYKNSTCVNTKADRAIEQHGAACFDTCPQPLDRNTDCYLDCYRNTLIGDVSLNITKPPKELLVDPWVRAMDKDDPADGGCPRVQPTA